MSSHIQKSHFDQRGQAVVEYLLVLLVLTFFFQVLYQMNTSFRQWAEDYYISYYRCLLETGEVPTLGGQQVQGLCTELYQPFTWQAGRPPLASGSGTDGSGAGGSDGTTGPGGSQGTNAEGGAVRGSEVSAVGRSGTSGRLGRFPDSRSRSGRGESGGEEKYKKESYTGSTAVTSFSLRTRVRRDEERTSQSDRDLAFGRKKQERGEEKSAVTGSKKEEGRVAKTEKFRVSREAASTELKEDESDFTFGDFFRILIIAAILIALAVLIGGQILQITKSLDAE